MQRNVGTGVRAYLGFGSVRSPTADAPLVARPGHSYLVGAFREDVVFYDGFIELPPRDAAVPPARRLTWVPEAMGGLGWRTNRTALSTRSTYCVAASTRRNLQHMLMQRSAYPS